MIHVDKKKSIGMELLSIDLGIGTIIDIEQLQAQGDSYFVVDFGSKNSKSYIPMTVNKKSRFLSNEDEFVKNLKSIKNSGITKEFQNKTERQKYFSTVLSDCHLNEIVNRISEIHSLEKLVPIEKEKLKKLIHVLDLEASAIFKMSTTDSQKFVSDFIQ